MKTRLPTVRHEHVGGSAKPHLHSLPEASSSSALLLRSSHSHALCLTCHHRISRLLLDWLVTHDDNENTSDLPHPHPHLQKQHQSPLLGSSIHLFSLFPGKRNSGKGFIGERKAFSVIFKQKKKRKEADRFGVWRFGTVDGDLPLKKKNIDPSGEMTPSHAFAHPTRALLLHFA